MWGYLDHVSYGHICQELPRGMGKPSQRMHGTIPWVWIPNCIQVEKVSRTQECMCSFPPLLQMPPTASSSCHFVFLSMAYYCLELWA